MDIRVRTFNELGLNAFSNKNYRLAVEYFDEALKIDPSYEAVKLNKCKVFIEKRSLVEAIGALDGILGENPSNEEAGKLRESCLNQLRRGPVEMNVPSKEPEVMELGQDEVIEIFEEEGDGEGEEETVLHPVEDERDDTPGAGELVKRKPVIRKEIPGDPRYEQIRSEAIEKSNEILRKVADYESRGIVITDIKAHLEKITKYMDTGKPKGALEVASECLEHLSEVKNRYDRTQRLVKRIQANILDLRGQGADVSDINAELESLPEMLRRGEYDDVLERTVDVLDHLARKKVSYQDALDSIRESWGSIKQALKEGVRDSEADEQLSKGRKSVTRGRYEEAIEHARRSQDIIHTSMVSRNKLREEFHTLKDRVDRCEEMGMNVAAFQRTITEIERHLEAGTIDLADDLVFRLKEDLFGQEEKYNRGMLHYKLTKHKVDGARAHGVDTSGMEQSLSTMLSEIRTGNYGNVPVIADEIQDFVGKSKTVQEQNRSLLSIEKAEELFNECRDLGLDVAGTSSSIKKAKLYFNEGDFEECYALGSEAVHSFNRVKLEYLLRNTRELLGELPEDGGLDKGSALKDLEEAEKLIGEEEYDDAHELVSSIRRPLFEERAQAQLIRTQEKLNEVEAMGGDIGEAKKLFGESKREYTKNDFERAFELSGQALETAENARMYEELIDELTGAREHIDVLEADGVDVEEAKEELARARPALESKFYQTALDYTKRSRELARKAKERHQFTVRIEKAERKIELLEETGGDVQILRDDLERARNALRKWERDRLESILFHVEDELKTTERDDEDRRIKEAKRLKKEGNRLFKAGDVKEAIRVFNKALKLNPGDETIIHNKGVAYKKIKMYDRALKCAERTLSMNPDYQAAQALKRMCEAELGKL